MRERIKVIFLFLFYSVFLGGLFAAVYGTTNQAGATALTPHKIYWDWELSIPFVPQMIYIYFSLNLLTACGMFYLSLKEVHALAATYAFAIITAGVTFLTFPTKLGFSRQGHLSEHADLFEVLYKVDLPHNLFPSLHVAIASIAVFTIHNKCTSFFKTFFLVWLFLIFGAVVLTHQHHFLDIIGGLILAGISVNVVFFPFVKHQKVT